MMLLIFAFSLNAIELNWGLSGAITWQPDAIEGEISLNHMPLLFQQWRHKYPRGLFLINGLFYKPMIDHWKKILLSLKLPTMTLNKQSFPLSDLRHWLRCHGGLSL